MPEGGGMTYSNLVIDPRLEVVFVRPSLIVIYREFLICVSWFRSLDYLQSLLVNEDKYEMFGH